MISIFREKLCRDPSGNNERGKQAGGVALAITRACRQLFNAIFHREAHTSIVVQCGYLEVYNERCRDLLGEGRNLKLREGKRGVAVDGLTFDLTPSADDVMNALWRGNAHRTVAAMKMNARSSRGHAILYVCVEERGDDPGWL